MPTEDDLDRVLEDLMRYAVDIGDEIDNEIEHSLVTRRDGTELHGFRCYRDESLYLICGNPEERFISVQYYSSVLNYITVSLSEEYAEEILSERELEENENSERRSTVEQAGLVLLDSVSDREADTLEGIARLVGNSNFSEINIFTTNSDIVYLFKISSKIFPYQNRTTVRQFYRTVQPVLSTAETLEWYLGESIQLDIDEEEPANTELSIEME